MLISFRKKSINGLLILLTSSCISALGCATPSRTLYQPEGAHGGYSETRMSDRLFATRFSGNAYTQASDAYLLSQFRSIELCERLGYQMARVHSILDQTQKKIVQRSSAQGYQSPLYLHGFSHHTTNSGYLDSYGLTHYSGPLYGGQQFTQGATWNETLSYPVFDTLFSCSDHAYSVNVVVESLSPEKVTPYVKDLLGAVHVKEIEPHSPNKGLLRFGDIVLKVNGERVTNSMQWNDAIEQSQTPTKPLFTIIRDGKPLTVRGIAVDSTEEFKIREKEIIAKACEIPEVKLRALCKSRLPASLDSTKLQK